MTSNDWGPRSKDLEPPGSGFQLAMLLANSVSLGMVLTLTSGDWKDEENFN
jgi:hypothetical protein